MENGVERRERNPGFRGREEIVSISGLGNA